MDVQPPDGTVESAIDMLERLIAFPSVSSTSNVAVTDWCAATLTNLGFSIARTEYDDHNGIRKANLVAVRQPTRNIDDREGADTGIAYFCHTDVVPANDWVGAPRQSDSLDNPLRPDPFRAVVTADRVYGRGACDMKGSLAAMLAAVARIDRTDQTAPVWIVCTADEEVGFNGAKHLVDHCPGYRELVRADPVTIIGEPTELNVVYAHKGIRGFTVRSRGRAGHSATSYGINANEAMVPMLAKLLELCQRTRDESQWQDDRFDPPLLSWNFGVSDHSNVVNITPERCDAWVSLRPMPEIDGGKLIAEAEQTAKQLGLSFEVLEGCDPLWNDPDSDFVAKFQSLAGTQTQTVSYSTDGGVLGELSRRVVIGPGSIRQAHTADEWISIDQLDRGITFYEQAFRAWCT